MNFKLFNPVVLISPFFLVGCGDNSLMKECLASGYNKKNCEVIVAAQKEEIEAMNAEMTEFLALMEEGKRKPVLRLELQEIENMAVRYVGRRTETTVFIQDNDLKMVRVSTSKFRSPDETAYIVDNNMDREVELELRKSCPKTCLAKMYGVIDPSLGGDLPLFVTGFKIEYQYR